MKAVKQLVASILIMIILCLTPAFASAVNITAGYVELSQLEAYTVNAESKALEGINTTSLYNVLYNGILNYETKISVLGYGILNTSENQEAISLMIYDDMPLAFYIDNIAIWHMGRYITFIEPKYLYSKEKSLKMVQECEAAAEKMVADIKRNNALTQAEKALLLHDRIATLCEYDQRGSLPVESFNEYGALVNRTAVCHGYAKAYNYVLMLVGMESYLCRSKELNHAWNIVTVDSNKYHVDITWDDPSWAQTKWDVVGKLKHTNFLQSSAAFYEEHAASDYDTSPTDTTYDNYYWQNSNTAFQLVNGKLYYFDNVSKTLNCKTDDTVLLTINDKWYASSNSYWNSNYTTIASDGEVLLFSQPKKITEYNPETGVSSEACAPDLSMGDFYSIYGFTYCDGYLVCDVNNSPNFYEQTMYRIKVLRDKVAPTLSVSVSNNCSSTQYVTLSMNDDIGNKGYYWGKSNEYQDNSFVECTQSSAVQAVSSDGTYYFTAVDNGYNVSETVSVCIVKTKLDANGGTTELEYVLTERGKVASLPTAQKENAVFGSWSTASIGGTVVSNTPVTENQTLYAVWYHKMDNGDINGDGSVCAADYVALKYYINGKLCLNNEQKYYADVNYDGAITTIDIVVMRVLLCG